MPTTRHEGPAGTVSRAHVPVRRLVLEDWEVLRDVRLAALVDSPGSFGSAIEAELRRSPSDWTDALTREAWFLAGTPDDPVGIVGYFPEDRYPDGFPQLGAMWVAPHARRQGVAAQLARRVAELADHCGEVGLGLWVTEDNGAAAAVYAHLGFAKSAGFKPAPRDPGVRMQRMTTTTLRRP
jgi:GNAT superfamily N-acetyltransferase